MRYDVRNNPYSGNFSQEGVTMGKKAHLIALAGELCSVGKDVERKRAVLKQLIDAGMPYDAPEVLSVLQEFQQTEAKWKQIEVSYLELRKELKGE